MNFEQLFTSTTVIDNAYRLPIGIACVAFEIESPPDDLPAEEYFSAVKHALDLVVGVSNIDYSAVERTQRVDIAPEWIDFLNGGPPAQFYSGSELSFDVRIPRNIHERILGADLEFENFRVTLLHYIDTPIALVTCLNTTATTGEPPSYISSLVMRFLQDELSIRQEVVSLKVFAEELECAEVDFYGSINNELVEEESLWERRQEGREFNIHRYRRPGKDWISVHGEYKDQEALRTSFNEFISNFMDEIHAVFECLRFKSALGKEINECIADIYDFTSKSMNLAVATWRYLTVRRRLKNIFSRITAFQLLKTSFIRELESGLYHIYRSTSQRLFEDEYRNVVNDIQNNFAIGPLQHTLELEKDLFSLRSSNWTTFLASAAGAIIGFLLGILSSNPIATNIESSANNMQAAPSITEQAERTN